MTRCALLHSPGALLTAKGHLAAGRNEKDGHGTQTGHGGKKKKGLAVPGTEG